MGGGGAGVSGQSLPLERGGQLHGRNDSRPPKENRSYQRSPSSPDVWRALPAMGPRQRCESTCCMQAAALAAGCRGLGTQQLDEMKQSEIRGHLRSEGKSQG